MAATTTRTRKASTTRTRKATARFDGSDGADWYKIPSKGQLYALAIAAYNGADFPGADVLRSRTAAKDLITELAEDGFIDKR